MSITVFVPCDSAALAAGAEAVVDALHKEASARGLTIDVQRNSTRGMFWLEPLVEVVTAAGRTAYGPVNFQDVPSLFEADFLHGGQHRLSLGLTDALPYLSKQQRLTFARMGITRPLSLDDYAAHGGWAGLQKTAAMDSADVVQTVLDSGLRGRGGAAFPAGIKWRTVRATDAAQKYVVCNADEGDSGTFSDRMTMEGDPYMLIEGMAIAGLAVGA
ncbi:MAG: formate dehydrogenase, partial [Burkholderiales bacterium]